MKQLWLAVRVSVVLMMLCGVAYPLAMTGISQVAFPTQANGSMITSRGKVVGSALLGQQFTDSRFFHGRLSAVAYNTYLPTDANTGTDGKMVWTGVASGGSNLAVSNPVLTERTQKALEDFIGKHPGVKPEEIPADLLSASGSGLDPDLTPASALLQVPSVSAASGIPEDTLRQMVEKYTTGRTFGLLGEPRVNVLKLNIAVAGKTGSMK